MTTKAENLRHPEDCRGCVSWEAAPHDYLPPVAGRGTSPNRLTIEGDGDGHVWVVCACGWLQDFGSVAEWGEVGWHVSQHADTHRRKP
jgi:hypothetical protein